MTSLVPVIIVAALLGTFLCATSLAKLRQRQLVGAGGRAVSGVAALLCASVLAGLAINLHTYRRLTYEQPVAELSFAQHSKQQYSVLLVDPDGGQRSFELTGDEWQLDARILKWHGVANLIGFDARYRVERLSGRYRDIEQEQSAPRSVHALSTNPGFDLWSLAQNHELPWVDAVYGSATYLPMRDQARFNVTLTQSGLIARAINAPGAQAVQDWQ